MSKEKIANLEHSLLEIGTELFKVKHALSTMNLQNESVLHMLSGLKNVLDEKGLVSREDFEDAVDLGTISELLQKFSEPNSELATRGWKKKTH